MTYRQAIVEAERLRARIVEHVYVKGSVRLNIVLPDGRPRTLKARLQ